MVAILDKWNIQMKKTKYGKIHNLFTEEDWRNHFRLNMLNNKVPVAMYFCIKCEEILENASTLCTI